MIHFRCSLCGKKLRVPERKAGKTIACPVCDGRTVVPAVGEDSTDAPPDDAVTQPDAREQERAPGPFSGVSRGMRWAAGSVAAVGLLALLLAIIRPPLPGVGGAFDARWGLLLAGCSFVLFATILHGEVTGCPSCRKWWSRVRVESEFLDRETFEKGGAPYARSLYRTTYACGDCHHRWKVTESEEYRATAGDMSRVPGGKRMSEAHGPRHSE